MTTQTEPTVWHAEHGTMPAWVSDGGIHTEYKALKGHDQRLANALTAYEKGKAVLLNEHGQPVYTDHEARLAALEAPLEATFTEVNGYLDELTAGARAAIAAEEAYDPVDRLTTAELDTVNRRRELVKEDCERLPLDQLATRLQGAVESGDRGLAYVWARYADVRAGAEVTKGGHNLSDQDALRQIKTLTTQARALFANPKAIARANATLRLAGEAKSQVREAFKRTPGFTQYQDDLRRRFGL